MTRLHRAPLALAVTAMLLLPAAPAFAGPDAQPPGMPGGRIPSAAKPDTRIQPPFMRIPGGRIPSAAKPDTRIRSPFMRMPGGRIPSAAHDARASYERLSRSPLRPAGPVRATIPKKSQAEVKRYLP